MSGRAAFAANMRASRMARDLSQKEMADFLGVPEGTYGAWENERNEPAILVALEVAEKLEVTVPELVKSNSCPTCGNVTPGIPLHVDAAEDGEAPDLGFDEDAAAEETAAAAK